MLKTRARGSNMKRFFKPSHLQKGTFTPPTLAWQKATSARLGLKMSKKLVTTRRGIGKPMTASTAPAKVHKVDVDGNCFLRALASSIYRIAGRA